MKKLFIILTFCLFINHNVYSETELVAKNYSYEASVHYINKDFESARELYKKSLEIRKNLNLKNEHYLTVLKMLIYSTWRVNTVKFCNFNIDNHDYMLLIHNDDKDFLYDFNFMNKHCEQFY